jgi:hypothetical protein
MTTKGRKSRKEKKEKLENLNRDSAGVRFFDVSEILDSGTAEEEFELSYAVIKALEEKESNNG